MKQLPKKKSKTKIQSIENVSESVAEYLARGGVITVCEPGARTEDIPQGQWTRNRSRVKAPTLPDQDAK
jgi:predicted peroxiredoxin